MRKKRTLKVDTFPFLAVLLGAMGALLLILMIMDRRAKVVARAKAMDAIARNKDDSEERKASLEKEWTRRREELHARLEHEDEETRHQTQMILAKLEESLSALGSDEERQRELQARLKEERAALAKLEEMIALEKARTNSASAQIATSSEEAKRMAVEIAQLERVLQSIKDARKRAAQTYSVLPYRGKQGDKRKPIYVECTEVGVIFHPERLTLTGIDVSRSAIRTEVEQRIAKQSNASTKSDEKKEDSVYLLLLVRPDGVANYYYTMEALKGLPVAFGYELVEADWALDFPKGDEDPSKQPWQSASRPTSPATLATPVPRSPTQGKPRGVAFGPGSFSDGGGVRDGNDASKPRQGMSVFRVGGPTATMNAMTDGASSRGMTGIATSTPYSGFGAQSGAHGLGIEGTQGNLAVNGNPYVGVGGAPNQGQSTASATGDLLAQGAGARQGTGGSGVSGTGQPGTGSGGVADSGQPGTGTGGTGQPGSGNGVVGGTGQPGSGNGVVGGNGQPGSGNGVVGGNGQPGTGNGVVGGNGQPGSGNGVVGGTGQPATGNGAIGGGIPGTRPGGIGGNSEIAGTPGTPVASGPASEAGFGIGNGNSAFPGPTAGEFSPIGLGLPTIPAGGSNDGTGNVTPSAPNGPNPAGAGTGTGTGTSGNPAGTGTGTGTGTSGNPAGTGSGNGTSSSSGAAGPGPQGAGFGNPGASGGIETGSAGVSSTGNGTGMGNATGTARPGGNGGNAGPSPVAGGLFRVLTAPAQQTGVAGGASATPYASSDVSSGDERQTDPFTTADGTPSEGAGVDPVAGVGVPGGASSGGVRGSGQGGVSGGNSPGSPSASGGTQGSSAPGTGGISGDGGANVPSIIAGQSPQGPAGMGSDRDGGSSSSGRGGSGLPAIPDGSSGPTERSNTKPSPRPVRLTGTRDWTILVECTSGGLVLYPGQKRITTSELAATRGADNPFVQAVQSVSTRRQAMVRPGEEPYRIQVRFLVRPDGLRTFHSAYPLIDRLSLPMTRQDIGRSDEVR